MDLQTLTDNFAIPGVLDFAETSPGMVCATITTPACSAQLYLHGAHLTAWTPAGHEPVLFLSQRSAFAPDKAIRGGIPIIFPWFGARSATPQNPRTDGRSHGFARTSPWMLVFAALAGDELHLTLALEASDLSRALGYDQFQLAYQLVLGRDLRLRLSVANLGSTPLHFEEALHTYFLVGDAEHITLHGLADTEYLDKTDNFARKLQPAGDLQLTAETDRPYLNTTAAISLDDPQLHRCLRIAKTNSQTTVIWNPWATLSAKLPDMDPDGWRTMTCVEVANAADNAITLLPREAYTMEAHVTVEEMA